MIFIDSHTHLFAEQFNEDREQVVHRALDVGVERFYLPNIDQETVNGMLAMAEKWPQHCFPMLGLHPTSIKEDFQNQLDNLHALLEKHQFYAIGETGLDFYWDTTFKQEQLLAFQQQIDWALSAGLPIVIHSRNSLDDGIQMISDKQNGQLRGVFHCFNGTLDQAKAIIDLGFYIGVGGVLTFKNGGMDSVLKEIPLEYLLLETDSPYLAPSPHRGKRNESAYIPLIAQKLADIKEIGINKVAEMTTNNSLELFKKQ